MADLYQKFFVIIFFMIAGFGQSTNAQSIQVDLELVLAVDGSRSVDADEFSLQTEGIAAAFLHEDVLVALSAAAPRGIAVALVQWAGSLDQLTVVDWHHLKDREGAQIFAEQILLKGRQVRPGGTDIGEAIVFSLALLGRNRFDGTRRVIDVSGDGYDNAGGRPETARDIALGEGVVINGLTILNETPQLHGYYARRVVGGPGSFVIEAVDYSTFATAFRLKLIREIAGQRLARAEAASIIKSDGTHGIVVRIYSGRMLNKRFASQ
ncbi:MAG: DUF1194 domain-containing protein [Paracoccaceae bacterium]